MGCSSQPVALAKPSSSLQGCLPPLPEEALDRPREYWTRAAFVRVPASHTPVRGEFGAASRHRGGAGQPRRREAHRSGRDPSALKQRKRTTALPATSGINTSA